ncbi:MAG: hypothetical protein PHT65_10350, partial [Proteiniphilum sp.]|nr:hypothetical protein [Proteiniphilum sp.]
QDAVLLCLKLFCCLVDGEIEWSCKQSILPGSSFIEGVFEAALAGENIGDEKYRGNKNNWDKYFCPDSNFFLVR